MKYIYLAGPITGCDYNQATDWREWVQSQLAPGLVGVSPMRLKDFLKTRGVIRGVYPEEPLSSLKGIATRDFFDIQTVDMILAYLPKEANSGKLSVGTLLELGIARGFHTPTVVVTDHPDLTTHGLIHEWCSMLVDTLDKGVEVVNGILGAYEPDQSTKWVGGPK